nr:hypothetical protein [Tanacetum cinerariifolium]
MFLVYGGNPKVKLRIDCYCNFGFETDRDDIKSQTGYIFVLIRGTVDYKSSKQSTTAMYAIEVEYIMGYVFILNGGAVDWKTSKQSTTAMSATKAEYIAVSEAAMEAVWIRNFISGLGVQRGARHYHRRYHYIRESIALGEIRFLKVHTDDNLAGPFTKALCNAKLTQHARSMGLRLASSFM